MDDLTVWLYAPGDEHAILTSFNAVFREVCGPTYVDRTLDHWRWQYADNPAGIRAHVAMTKDGICAAHYAALPVRAVTPRGPTVFSQIVDSFVLQRFRQGLKRPGLFVGTAVPAMEHWLSLGDAMFHGMPVEDARRMSVRFMGYTTWRSIDYLVRDAREGGDAVPSGIAIAAVAKVSPDADGLAALASRSRRTAQPCATPLTSTGAMPIIPRAATSSWRRAAAARSSGSWCCGRCTSCCPAAARSPS